MQVPSEKCVGDVFYVVNCWRLMFVKVVMAVWLRVRAWQVKIY